MQKYRKSTTQTYVELAREKGDLFDHWCAACRVNDFPSLWELILIEEFKKSLPERMLVHFNEEKISSLSAAAVMADELMVVFPASEPSERSRVAPLTLTSASQGAVACKEERVCFYSRKEGHIIGNRPALKRKEQNLSSTTTGSARLKDVGAIIAKPPQVPSSGDVADIEGCFETFPVNKTQPSNTKKK